MPVKAHQFQFNFISLASLEAINLTHFWPMFPLYTPVTNVYIPVDITLGYLMFSFRYRKKTMI